MNKHDFKINYDFRPYLPDIFVKSNIYNSCDIVNNNTNTDINTMIFVININRPLRSQYNDPNYILFGIKNPNAPEEYQFPSLNFFSPITENNIRRTINIDNTTNIITAESQNILNLIGYDLKNIDENEYQFSILNINENISQNEYKIYYFYFNLINYNSEHVNYNKYGTSLYYDNLTYNVLIYPFYNNEFVKYSPIKMKRYIDNITKSLYKKSILNIDFDNREIIKYYEKIDYKYFENTNFTMSEKTNIDTLKNYSLNIKNYVEYTRKTNTDNDVQIINVSLNEISKLFYYSTEYNIKNKKSYTITELNNIHINNNNINSNQNNRYSYTMDNKLSNINNFDNNSKKYSMYYYTTNTFESSLYQQTRNYYINFYYNIVNINNNSLNQMIKLNILLHKILVFINPKIIDLNYLLTNVNISIISLFKESNNLEFGKNEDKLNLYIVGDIIQTTIYYINKYKITFEFIDDINNIKFSYIIILNIVFYNETYFSILDIDSTTNSPLVYTNYTNIEESVSLMPSIYSFYTNTEDNYIFFYNTLNSYNGDNNINNYYWNINYSGQKVNNTSNEITNMFNFYSIIPNIKTNLKTSTNQYYNNVINVLKNELNNYIKKFINIEKKYLSYTHYKNNVKKYINQATLYDETIITESTGIKYIEYYNYFPKLSADYLSLANNYIGKYYQILEYLSNNSNQNQNKSSFVILPAGKYIKFNYINYSSLQYPTDTSDIEYFVKSIKTIDLINNYYYSLFIMLPLNINQDNEFQCVVDDMFINQTTYSMGIGGNKTSMYLVLTDINGVPYNFYSENVINSNEGIIFGIKLYDYNNYISPNLKLEVIPNLYITQYLNLNEFIILMENFSDYSDTNNVLWDINNTYLKLHNFDSLKEIILYDYKRFKTTQDINLIKEQYLKFNYKTLQILYENKTQLNNLRYGIKILIYISNLYKIIKLIQKMYSYYEIVKINIMLGLNNNEYIIKLLKYNSGIISNLFEINYNLTITSGNFETIIYTHLTKMYEINQNITLSEIVIQQANCIYIINYSLSKLPSILNLVISTVSDTENLYHNLYYQIFEQIVNENINYLIQEQIIYDIDNFTNTTNITVFDNIFDSIDLHKKQLFLKQINAYLKSIAFNMNKIDELYNLVKLMGDYNLDSIVVKNDYIYNTTCYTEKTNLPKFKIIIFLENTIELINKLSLPSNNPNYEIYQKSISQGIITFATNTIKYFKDIIDEITGIYIYIKNLPGIGININNPEEIGNFYSLLNLFFTNYNGFFNILFQNKINKFYEYSNLKIMFDNLFYSCYEFLLYICLKNDFINENTLFISENIFVNEDLYKIIKTDIFNDFSIKTIQNIENLVIIKNPQLTKIYLEKIKTKIEMEPKVYINIQTIKIIDEMLLELTNEIKSNTSVNNFINFGSYYIVPYQDLLLLKDEFNWSSFNFKQDIINVIKNVNSVNLSIYTYYYENKEINDFYKQALNYSYLETPYNYININNTNNIY